MDLQSASNLFTFLFVTFTIPIIIFVFRKKALLVTIIKKILYVFILSSLYLLFQFIQTIVKDGLAIEFVKLKLITAVWIIPFYVSFLSTMAMRKISKYIIYLFAAFSLIFSVFLYLNNGIILVNSGVFKLNTLISSFLLFFLAVIDFGAIIFGIEIFFLKSRRKYSTTVFVALIFLCTGISIDLLRFILGYKLSSLFFPISLMITYLFISYKLIIKFLHFYDNISKHVNLEKELKEVNLKKTCIIPDTCKNKENIATSQIKVRLSGGDFLLYHENNDSQDCFVLGDVHTTGIQSTLLETMSTSYVKVFLDRGLQPKDVLTKTNNFICSEQEMNPEVSLVVCKRDKQLNEIIVASAGHSHQYLYSARMDKTLPLKVSGKNIGNNAKSLYEEKKFKYDTDDLLVIFSDGLTKAKNSNDQFYDIQQLHSVLRRKASQDPLRIVNAIINSFKEFDAFNIIRDDVSIIVVKLN